MNNEQIITNIAISIYGEEVVANMVENGDDIPLHTMKGWALRGPFRVKKGEHGFETKLWKKRKKKEDVETEEDSNGEFYLAKAFLFRKDQIERVEE